MVDVRLRPDRASLGIYTQAKSPEKGIQGLLRKEGIRYVSLVELGNLFMGDAQWRERYHRLITQAGDLLVERLSSIADPLCLLCAEQRAAECHRHMIAEYLTQRNWEVKHLE